MSLLCPSKAYIQQAVKRISSIKNNVSYRSSSSLAKDLQGQSEAAAECMILEDKFGAHNYHPVSATHSNEILL